MGELYILMVMWQFDICIHCKFLSWDMHSYPLKGVGFFFLMQKNIKSTSFPQAEEGGETAVGM